MSLKQSLSSNNAVHTKHQRNCLSANSSSDTLCEACMFLDILCLWWRKGTQETRGEWFVGYMKCPADMSRLGSGCIKRRAAPSGTHSE